MMIFHASISELIGYAMIAIVGLLYVAVRFITWRDYERRKAALREAQKNSDVSPWAKK